MHFSKPLLPAALFALSLASSVVAGVTDEVQSSVRDPGAALPPDLPGLYDLAARDPAGAQTAVYELLRSPRRRHIEDLAKTAVRKTTAGHVVCVVMACGLVAAAAIGALYHLKYRIRDVWEPPIARGLYARDDDDDVLNLYARGLYARDDDDDVLNLYARGLYARDDDDDVLNLYARGLYARDDDDDVLNLYARGLYARDDDDLLGLYLRSLYRPDADRGPSPSARR